MSKNPDYQIDLIVPVYRNRELTGRCLDSLVANVREIAPYQPRIIVVNDSPDDAEVTEYLRRFQRAQPTSVLLENEQNRGFVKSVNRALALTREARRAAVLINSDTETFPGTLLHLLAAAETDPQIGFACPRSNNAAISTFPQLPHSQGGRSLTPEHTYRNWRDLSHLLPQVTYAPTAVGFYLFIRREVVLDFAPLNEDFELGYEEENDLVMRANKVGYRAALANHAFAFHAGSASFLLHEADLDSRKSRNLHKLMGMHPEFLPLVRQYESSPEARAERLLKNLLPSQAGTLRMLIDLNRMGPYTNGTSELSVAVVERILLEHADRFDVTVVCSRESFKFHELDRFPNLRRIDAISGDYAIAVNLGQPFDLHQINVLETSAPVNVYGMLDTIAQDCGHLAVDSDLGAFWKYVADHANGVFYISDFARATFTNRYPRCHPSHYTRLLPTRLADYAQQYEGVPQGERHILVMGNHFPHKASQPVGEFICGRFPNATVAVLGSGEATRPNMQAFRSGHVEDRQMKELFAGASVVVLPSYYEGFGFSLLHALALGKPVVARNIPATREILATFGSASGIFLFDADDEIPGRLVEAIAAARSRVDDSRCIGWSEWVAGFVDFLRGVARDPDLYARCVERLYAGDALRGARELRNVLQARVPSALPAIVTQQLPEAPLAPATAAASEFEQATPAPSTATELMRLDGRQFLNEAYRAILRRPPDPVGLSFYEGRMEAGFDKRDVLVDLATSKEGRTVAPRLEGLDDLLKRSVARRLKKRLFGSK